jgi:hypothetical protein
VKRVRWTLLLAALVASVLNGFLGRPPSAEAAGEPACLPDKRLPVTVLARGGAGSSFTGVDGDGIDPYIDPRSNRTMAPLRSLFQALSPGTDAVRWVGETYTAQFWWNGHTLSITIPPGADRTYTGLVDGKPVGVTAFLCNGRVWGQVRSVVEALHIDVQYYDPAVVVIDPVGGLPTPEHLRTTTTASTVSRSCGSAPSGFLGFLASPIGTTRRAGNYVACILMSY